MKNLYLNRYSIRNIEGICMPKEYIIKGDLFPTPKKATGSKKTTKPKEQYHTIGGIVAGTGEKTGLPPPKTEKPQITEEEKKVAGYSLAQIDTYFENFLKGNLPGSTKEKRFRELLNYYFQDIEGHMTMQSKAKTLSAWIKDGFKSKLFSIYEVEKKEYEAYANILAQLEKDDPCLAEELKKEIESPQDFLYNAKYASIHKKYRKYLQMLNREDRTTKVPQILKPHDFSADKTFNTNLLKFLLFMKFIEPIETCLLQFASSILMEKEIVQVIQKWNLGYSYEYIKAHALWHKYIISILKAINPEETTVQLVIYKISENKGEELNEEKSEYEPITFDSLEQVSWNTLYRYPTSEEDQNKLEYEQEYQRNIDSKPQGILPQYPCPNCDYQYLDIWIDEKSKYHGNKPNPEKHIYHASCPNCGYQLDYLTKEEIERDPKSKSSPFFHYADQKRLLPQKDAQESRSIPVKDLSKYGLSSRFIAIVTKVLGEEVNLYSKTPLMVDNWAEIIRFGLSKDLDLASFKRVIPFRKYAQLPSQIIIGAVTDRDYHFEGNNVFRVDYVDQVLLAFGEKSPIIIAGDFLIIKNDEIYFLIAPRNPVNDQGELDLKDHVWIETQEYRKLMASSIYDIIALYPEDEQIELTKRLGRYKKVGFGSKYEEDELKQRLIFDLQLLKTGPIGDKPIPDEPYIVSINP